MCTDAQRQESSEVSASRMIRIWGTVHNSTQDYRDSQSQVQPGLARHIPAALGMSHTVSNQQAVLSLLETSAPPPFLSSPVQPPERSFLAPTFNPASAGLGKRLLYNFS